MLLLCIFLVSCCLPGSMGDAVEEFQGNLKTLVTLAALAKDEIFLPVPEEKFQCSHIPCQLEKIIERLKVSFKNDPERTRIFLMEKNLDHITSTLKKTHTPPENTMSCTMREVSPQRAQRHFKRYFQRVQENCWDS